MGEVIRILIVTGMFLLALWFIEALIRYRDDYRKWNDGICPKTGKPWRVRRRSDGRFELVSGEHLATVDGWILPFEPERVL